MKNTLSLNKDEKLYDSGVKYKYWLTIRCMFYSLLSHTGQTKREEKNCNTLVSQECSIRDL